MTELPNPRTARVQALLAAFASWVFVLWLVGMPFLASRPYVFAGLFVSAIIWAGVIVISLSLKCPHCGKSIAIKTQSPPRLGPDWQAARKQFFPIEAFLGKATSIVCPHCGVQLSIALGAKSVT